MHTAFSTGPRAGLPRMTKPFDLVDNDCGGRVLPCNLEQSSNVLLACALPLFNQIARQHSVYLAILALCRTGHCKKRFPRSPFPVGRGGVYLESRDLQRPGVQPE